MAAGYNSSAINLDYFPDGFLTRFFFFCGNSQSKPGRTAVTALPYADHKTEVLNLLLSIPKHMWAVANNYILSNERQLLEYSMCLQLGCQNRTFCKKVLFNYFCICSQNVDFSNVCNCQINSTFNRLGRYQCYICKRYKATM